MSVRRATAAWAAVLAMLGAVEPLAGQGYRLRVDTRYQAVSFRGIQADSILATEVIAAPGQGPTTPDGFAVACATGAAWCDYFRPGPRQQSHPIASTADLTLYDLGVPGLTIHAAGRWTSDLASDVTWPGTTPRLVLFEGFAQYERGRLRARAGRQTVAGRLGYQGFDGAQLEARGLLDVGHVSVFGGWGVARGAALPVTSPALNPLDDFQPRDRQLLVGAEAGVRVGVVEASVDYRREIDPVPDYLVSERASASVTLTPRSGWQLSGGAEYDLASGWWGSADATLSHTRDGVFAAVTARRYRPFFDLWTIWGAFSPVPYSAVSATAAVRPHTRLWVRGNLERFWYAEDDAESPLVSASDRGWRTGLSILAILSDRWNADLGVRRETGPGAAGLSVDAGTSFTPRQGWTFTGRAGTLDRPLEFRFSASRLTWLSLGGDVRLGGPWRGALDLSWFGESRDRPDPAAFDFNQLRVSTRLVLELGSAADRLPPALPPARRGR